MPSSPNSSGQGLSAAIQSVAGVALAAESLELTTIASELLPLGLDDVRRGPVDEPFVAEDPFGARDLPAEPLDLGGRVAVRPDSLRLHDSLEDAELVAVEVDPDAAAAEECGSLLHAIERVTLVREAVICLGPRRDDQAPVAIREL